jgi:hypothetical protein
MRSLVVAALAVAALAVEMSMIDDSNKTMAPIEIPTDLRVGMLRADGQQGELHNVPLHSIFDGTPEGTDLQWVGRISVGTPPQSL